MTASIIEGLTFQREYELKYGERSVFLYQLGTFYETWEYDPSYCKNEEDKIDKNGTKWTEHIGHSVKLSVLLNYNLCQENNSKPYSIKNPSKLGFPVISADKNIATLLANDYVVIKYDQQGSGKNITRAVTEILSPTMQIDSISLTRATSNVACIYIEYQKGNIGKYENFLITTGVSVVDIITGQNKVCEFYSKTDDQVHAIQELYRFLTAHSPRELIIHVNDLPKGLDTHSQDSPNPYIKYLESILELKRYDRLNYYVNSISADYKKSAYQIEFFNKIFGKNESSSTISTTSKVRFKIIKQSNPRIVSDLGLERMNYGIISYITLLQHCHSYNSNIIVKLSKPNLQWLDENNHLILTHNAIIQLELIPAKENKMQRKKEIDSLLSVLDHCRTNLGKRALNNILQNPMLKSDEINKYYEMVSEMSLLVNNDEPMWSVLDRQLRELPDLGRLQRKLELKLINPKELSVLIRAYTKIVNIYITNINVNAPTFHTQLFTQEEIIQFNEFLTRYNNLFNLDALECCHIASGESNSKWIEFDNYPINTGYYPELDEYNNQLATAENHLQLIIDHLNTFLVKTTGKKIEYKTAKRKQGAQKQDPTGTLISTTTAKANKLSNAAIDVNLCGDLEFYPHTSTEKKISSNVIENLSNIIDTNKSVIRKKLLVIYEAILDEMNNNYNFYVTIANIIAKIDLIHCYALVSDKYNYHRPEIIDVDGPSFLEAHDLRHGIIERIIDYPYVTNDVHLGKNENYDIINNRNYGGPNGMILMGINQSGKSSTLKALSITIIMAQIGCYTPAKLRYKPYNKIITRLSSNDNLFKGESTFIVEASEIRTIIRQSDLNTLCVIDEACKGSEIYSAASITIALIKNMINHQSSFMLSTHLHSIITLPFITEINKTFLEICHLSVIHDELTDKLIYDRKLKPGGGSTIYGITVVKSLGFPTDFTDSANEILLYLMGQSGNILDTKTSRHNSKVYIHSCAICEKTSMQTELHTHHIIEQSKADARGLIEHFDKNIKDNLIILCKNCHQYLHINGIKFVTVQSSDGILVKLDI